MHADDPDSPSSDLAYTVLHQGAKAGEERGYVERVGQPGVRVDGFTQSEVDSGVIAYVHRGKEGTTTQRLALQVTISQYPLTVLDNTCIPVHLPRHSLSFKGLYIFCNSADISFLIGTWYQYLIFRRQTQDIP